MIVATLSLSTRRARNEVAVSSTRGDRDGDRRISGLRIASGPGKAFGRTFLRWQGGAEESGGHAAGRARPTYDPALRDPQSGRRPLHREDAEVSPMGEPALGPRGLGIERTGR